MSADAAVPPPRETAALIGHPRAEAALLAAARGGRLPHAWLIGGPAGVGKATLAFRFARFLLAGMPAQGGRQDTLAIPESDPVFRRVAAGGHADLLTVERPFDEKRNRRTTELPVDEVRKVAPFLHLTSAEDGWRVVIIDDADRMNRSSANAILKVLEEPPERALLMLLCSSPGALQPTLRSRCRRLDLEKLGEEEVASWLSARTPDLAAEDRALLARLADGSIGRAAELAAGGGLAEFRNLYDLLDELPRPDMLKVHKLADRLAAPAAEEAWRTATDLLRWWVERLVRTLATGRPAAELMAGEGALMGRLSGGRGLDPWLEVWEKIDRLVRRADGANLDRKQVILAAFSGLEAAARA